MRSVIVQTVKSILGALGIVAIIFGVPVLATLLAGQFGMSFRLVGWVTLLGMIVLAYQSRGMIGRMIGQRRLAPAIVRRNKKLR